MSSQPFMQLYVGDYLADTTDLTCEQHGAYLLLLMTMWRHGAKLPNDRSKLARIARLPPRRWDAVWAEISRFFIDDGEHIRNSRLSKEHQKATAKSEVRAQFGRKGGLAKPLKSKDQGQANASDLLKHGQKSEPESDNKREANASLRRPRKPRPERFQEFWDQFPHRNGAKKGRAKSERLYAQAVASGVPEGELIAAAMRYAGDAQVLRGYGKGPEPWLNQKCWQDEIEQPQLKAITGGRYGERPDHDDRQSPHGRPHRPDPALERIAYLAGIGEASGNGRG